MAKPYISDEARRARNRDAVYRARSLMNESRAKYDADSTPVERPVMPAPPTKGGIRARHVALIAGAMAAAAAVGVLFGGCAHQEKKTVPKFGASLIFPGGGSSSGSSGGTVDQGTPAAGANAWPVALTEDGTNTIVKAADNANKAIRVNVVAGGAAGGTSSSFGAAVPATGTAAGASDGTNMQLPRVFDGDSGAGTQYVSGSILRKSASGGTVEAGTSTDPLRVDPTGSTTQPVSGTVAATQSGGWTVTANAGTDLNTSALVLESTFGRAQGSATAGQTGPLIQGAVTTSAPSYTTAQTSPLSLTTSGLLRIDGSGATQPVSGTVTANQGGTWTVQPGNTANTTPWLVAGGSTFYSTSIGPALQAAVTFSESVASTGATNVMVPLSIDRESGGLRVGGTVAHDSVGTAVEPVITGGISSAAAPTDVTADGDAVRAWFLRNGAQAMQLTLNGNLASTGVGATGTGTLRTDSNLSLSGVAASSGNGTSGTGVLRVAQVSDGTGVLANVATIGTSVTPGTGATQLGKAEDAAHASGDVGVMAMAVRKDTNTQATSADTDYSEISVDAYGAVFSRADHPNRFTCSLDAVGTTLTQCQAAPGASLSLYVTDVIAQSTTGTAGQFGLRFGTGANCGTGTGNLLMSSTATARIASPANTVAPTEINFNTPLKVTANNAICVVGVVTNTTSIQISGYTAP